MANPPFLPPKFPSGPPTAPAWEDGASIFANAGPVIYNGQNQTSRINTAQPMPAWELGCGPADPAISNVQSQGPVGNGYARPVGKGTIGVGNVIMVPSEPGAAQVRFYVATPSGNIYILENQGGSAGVITATGAGAQPIPPYYAPTK